MNSVELKTLDEIEKKPYLKKKKKKLKESLGKLPTFVDSVASEVQSLLSLPSEMGEHHEDLSQANEGDGLKFLLVLNELV